MYGFYRRQNFNAHCEFSLHMPNRLQSEASHNKGTPWLVKTKATPETNAKRKKKKKKKKEKKKRKISHACATWHLRF